MCPVLFISSAILTNSFQYASKLISVHLSSIEVYTSKACKLSVLLLRLIFNGAYRSPKRSCLNYSHNFFTLRIFYLPTNESCKMPAVALAIVVLIKRDRGLCLNPRYKPFRAQLLMSRAALTPRTKLEFFFEG